MRSLSWRQRVEKGCHATWIQKHSSETSGSGCVLEGPLTDCHVESWYVIVGPALPAVRNSPFCEGGMLNQLNEALVDSARGSEVDGAALPPCDRCRVDGAASILSDVAGLSTCSAGGGGSSEKRRCLVFGSRSLWDSCQSQLGDFVLTFPAEPSFPRRRCVTLHDGEPLQQQELLRRVVSSLQSLGSGDVLLLPLVSAFTRVTAAVVLCLHVCFRSVTFRCPSSAVQGGAVLLCVGFCPNAAARVLPALADVQRCMGQLRAGGDAADRQVLQFVPMEELLAGGLTHFLWSMNSEIIRHTLHCLVQA